ncbi:hypothetical protein VEGS18_A45630 (plasmid) [Escherichia coli]|nr:hypothetical protein VEGS18_A45630 [Escherichia coli]BEC25666.1 hypothetical protein VEE50_44670 [Escherichia coli]
MRLLKPGVKTTGMNIQHPTEQANRPATGVVTDKGVPQSDSFAKYATLDQLWQAGDRFFGRVAAVAGIFPAQHIRQRLLRQGRRLFARI